VESRGSIRLRGIDDRMLLQQRLKSRNVSVLYRIGHRAGGGERGAARQQQTRQQQNAKCLHC
jgi:hypothetical protein